MITLKNVHWIAPFAQADWTDSDGHAHEIVMERAQSGDEVFMIFDDAATRSSGVLPVLAPLSGTVVGLDPSTLVDGAVDVEILTELEDGTQIVNLLKGVTEVPHFGLAPSVKIVQGDPIGESNWSGALLSFLGLQQKHDLPLWYCYVKRPGETDGSIVYADDAAENKGRGLDWFVDTKKDGIPELLVEEQPQPAPVNPFPVNPLKPPVKTPSKGGLGKLLLLGGVLWALLAKRK
jgi:hypothetical protein